MPLQWRNQIWQSTEEGAGKRYSECEEGAGKRCSECEEGAGKRCSECAFDLARQRDLPLPVYVEPHRFRPGPESCV